MYTHQLQLSALINLSQTPESSALENAIGLCWSQNVHSSLLPSSNTVSRFLAANATAPSYSAANGDTQLKSFSQKTACQPKSLQKNHLYLTPSSRASMLKSGRGVAASCTSGSNPSKVTRDIHICQKACLERHDVLVPIMVICASLLKLRISWTGCKAGCCERFARA